MESRWEKKEAFKARVLLIFFYQTLDSIVKENTLQGITNETVGEHCYVIYFFFFLHIMTVEMVRRQLISNIISSQLYYLQQILYKKEL